MKGIKEKCDREKKKTAECKHFRVVPGHKCGRFHLKGKMIQSRGSLTVWSSAADGRKERTDALK